MFLVDRSLCHKRINAELHVVNIIASSLVRQRDASFCTSSFLTILTMQPPLFLHSFTSRLKRTFSPPYLTQYTVGNYVHESQDSGLLVPAPGYTSLHREQYCFAQRTSRCVCLLGLSVCVCVCLSVCLSHPFRSCRSVANCFKLLNLSSV